MTEKLRIGQKIYVTSMHSEEQYVSSVYDMDSKGIYVPIPFAISRPLVLERGDRVRVRYIGQGSAYVFVTEAIGRKMEQDKLPMYIFKHPEESEISKVQLREFVRVPVMIDVMYAVPPEKNETPVFEKASSVDLSGGGMKIAVKEPISRGTIVLLCFTLKSKAKKKEQELKLLARVIRCELVDQDMGTYHACFRFLDIRQPQQDLIVAYVFERMVEIKRRQ